MSGAAQTAGLFSRVVSQAAGLATAASAATLDPVRTSIRPVLPYTWDSIPRDMPAWHPPVATPQPMSHPERPSLPRTGLSPAPPSENSDSARRQDTTLDAPLLTGRETASRLAVSDSNAGDVVRSMNVSVARAIALAPEWVTPAAPLISSPVESRVLPSIVPAQRVREAVEHPESPRFAAMARRDDPDGMPERVSHSGWNKEGPTRNIAVRPEESLRSLRSRASTADVLLAPVNASMFAPTIEVHIGRIEIRTPSAASKPATASSAANHEKSLAAHLWTRSRGARS